jgi:hypothetical protein
VWFSRGYIQENFSVCEVDGCSVSLEVFASSLSQSRERLMGGFGKDILSQLGTEQIADGIFGYSTVNFFFLVIPL